MPKIRKKQDKGMIGSPDLPKNPKTGKKLKTRIFAKNLKRHKSKFYGCPASCKKNRKNYSAVLAADGRTHRHTGVNL